jgi:hypothetical protein
MDGVPRPDECGAHLLAQTEHENFADFSKSEKKFKKFTVLREYSA